MAFNSGTVSDTVVSLSDLGFSAGELTAARRAVFSAHGGEVHYRYDGGDPSATVGIMLDDDTLSVQLER